MKPEEIDPQKAQNLVPMIGPGFYKELLDNMSDGVYFVDRERRIVYWNEGASRLTGYAAEDILGKHCQDDILCHVDLDGKHLCQEGCPLSASIDDRDGGFPSPSGYSPFVPPTVRSPGRSRSSATIRPRWRLSERPKR
jgi:PAS domain-containing protein